MLLPALVLAHKAKVNAAYSELYFVPALSVGLLRSKHTEQRDPRLAATGPYLAPQRLQLRI